MQETKVEGDIKEIVSQIWGGRWVRYASLEASGTRGGILLLWDCRVWKGEVLQTGAYTLTCKFEALLQNFQCHITGVYAPNCRIERKIVWREIGAVRGLMEGPWAVCGDFNVTRYPSEKRECLRGSKAMVEFSDFIEDMELIDLRLEGGYYTWFRGDNHTATSRIDRFLISEEWDESFRNIKQTIQQRLISDHSPVALYCGRPDYILACKLKALKGKLKEWSKVYEGNLGLQKTKLPSQLAGFETTQQLRALTEEKSVRKAATLMEIEEQLKNEESVWRQKSRALWLKEGDRNTKFFHRTANAHKRNNNIDQLMIRHEVVEDPDRIEIEITEFYKELYKEPEEWRSTVNFENSTRISESERELLQSNFEEQEVLTCLKMCASDKAPGPDGYTIGFFRKCWDILKKDIMAAFNNFHS
ncbi:uncharacterized protein LOC142182049 [Nicotiana tabacum]|uniref:Uncharacterized protein LOC142182049 n=1 Tax=Nicotiana tabacum TaxID=4097 RepID=A0AC58UR99_TOBAC